VTLLLDCVGIMHVIEFLIKLVGKFTCMLDVNMVLGCCSRHLSILSKCRSHLRWLRHLFY